MNVLPIHLLLFRFLGRARWPQPSSTFHIGPLDDRTPHQWRGGSCQPRRILSFYRSALLRKGAGVRRNILRRKIG